MSDKCPYCGTTLSSSLNFCVSCRRAVSDEHKQLGAGQGFEDQVGLKAFKLSKKEYSAHRAVRSFFFSLSTVLMLFLVFFVSMKFFLHKSIPGEEQLTNFVKQIVGGTTARP